MAPPIGLINLSVGDLIGAAGGDPWKLDDELQAGDPAKIDAEADAFHTAAGSATEIEGDFKTAKQRFQQGWRHNGTQHPINESAEVTEATTKLHLQKSQLGLVALDLETVAAALATAQRTSDGDIGMLNANLHQIDDAIGKAKAAKQDIKELHDAAVSAVRTALTDIQGVHGKYVSILTAAEKSLATTAGTKEGDSGHPEWLGDALIGSAGGVSGMTADGVRGAVLKAIEDGPKTGPGAVEPGLLKWLEDPRMGGLELKGFSRIGGVAALVATVPAIFSDIHGGNSVQEAVTREGAGTALGLAAGGWVGGAVAGSEMGAAIGSVIPGAGTALGLVAGAAIGGLVSYGASKGIEAAWHPVTHALSGAAHGVESFFGLG